MRKIKWSYREDEYLLEAYTNLHADVGDIAGFLGRSVKAVRKRLELKGMTRGVGEKLREEM